MAWTISDAVTETRRLLQDTRSPFRFDDARLIQGLNQAMAETRRLRPDLFLGLDFNLPYYTDAAADMAKAFPIDEMYFPSIVDYMVARQAFADDEFAVDGRAMAFVQKWQGNLIGGAGG